MYSTKTVYMTEDFIMELRKFMSVTRSNLVEEIQKRGDKYEVGMYFPLFIIYKLM